MLGPLEALYSCIDSDLEEIQNEHAQPKYARSKLQKTLASTNNFFIHIKNSFQQILIYIFYLIPKKVIHI